MNKVIQVGRIAKKPNIFRQQSGSKVTTVAKFVIAVQRDYSDKNGNFIADFIQWTAFDKTAEFVEKYYDKGLLVEVSGKQQSGSYEKDGKPFFTTENIVERTKSLEAFKTQDESEAGESVAIEGEEEAASNMPAETDKKEETVPDNAMEAEE